jgi:hypothetical protein
MTSLSQRRSRAYHRGDWDETPILEANEDTAREKRRNGKNVASDTEDCDENIRRKKHRVVHHRRRSYSISDSSSEEEQYREVSRKQSAIVPGAPTGTTVFILFLFVTTGLNRHTLIQNIACTPELLQRRMHARQRRHRSPHNRRRGSSSSLRSHHRSSDHRESRRTRRHRSDTEDSYSSGSSRDNGRRIKRLPGTWKKDVLTKPHMHT